MYALQDLTILPDVEYSAGETAAQHLEKLLRAYGYRAKLFVDREGDVLVDEIIRDLPEKVGEAPNSAREALVEYVDAIPRQLRVYGVRQSASHVFGLLQDRLEFFEGLSRNLVRMCKGRSCPNYRVCPYGDLVKDVTLADRALCSVERDVIKRATRDFLLPKDGAAAGRLDPRVPEIAVLFRQLAECLVQDARYGMYMQEENAMAEQWEILDIAKGVQGFDTKNFRLHPMAVAYERNQQQMLRVMRELGLTLEFQIRHNLLAETDSYAGIEERQREISEAKMRQLAEHIVGQIPEGSLREQLTAQLGLARRDEKPS